MLIVCYLLCIFIGSDVDTHVPLYVAVVEFFVFTARSLAVIAERDIAKASCPSVCL